MTAPYANEFSLIDLLLADQRDMSAVERFSVRHEHLNPSQRSYENLIPLSRPQPGEQYAFVVDLDRCSGCKACVSACHSLNGLEEGEMWRSVGTLIGEDSPYLQTITSSCHHCVDPACAAGCPVLAYEKDEETGIVRHLDDQCIGCQYCVLKCPYDVPKYSERKGIIRKCDMCHNRLGVGEAPACAQACPHEAIRIEIVDQNAIRVAGSNASARLIPGAFPSSYTLPTTRYESARSVPIESAEVPPRLENPHWALIVMLILTQISAGLHLVSASFAFFKPEAPVATLISTAAWSLIAGLVASVSHLGRPLKAWRSFLGWRRSWMSREILAFSVYLALATALLFSARNTALGVTTAAVGLLSVACSAMIYVDTRRPGWSARSVFPSFFGTVSLLGPTVAAAICGVFAPVFAPALTFTAIIIRAALFVGRWSSIRWPNNPARRLVPITLSRSSTLFAISTITSILAIFNSAQLGPLWGVFACASTIAAQLFDRWLFFVATPAPRMPGSFSSIA